MACCGGGRVDGVSGSDMPVRMIMRGLATRGGAPGEWLTGRPAYNRLRFQNWLKHDPSGYEHPYPSLPCIARDAWINMR